MGNKLGRVGPAPAVGLQQAPQPPPQVRRGPPPRAAIPALNMGVLVQRQETAAQRRAAQAAAAGQQTQLDMEWSGLARNIPSIEEDKYGEIYNHLMRIIIGYYLTKKGYSDAMTEVADVQQLRERREGLKSFTLERAKSDLKELRGVLRRAENKGGLVALIATATASAAASTAAAAAAAAAAPAARAAAGAAAGAAAAAAARDADAVTAATIRALPEDLKNRIRLATQAVAEATAVLPVAALPVAAAAAAAATAAADAARALDTNNFVGVKDAVNAAFNATNDTPDVAAARVTVQLAEQNVQEKQLIVGTPAAAPAAAAPVVASGLYLALENANNAVNALGMAANEDDLEDAMVAKQQAQAALQAAIEELDIAIRDKDTAEAQLYALTDTPAMAEARRDLQGPAAGLKEAQAELARANQELAVLEEEFAEASAAVAGLAGEALIAARKGATDARRKRDDAQAAVANAERAVQAATAVRDTAQAALVRASDVAAQAEYKREQVAALAATNTALAGPVDGTAAEAAFTASNEHIRTEMLGLLAPYGFTRDGTDFIYALVTTFFDDTTTYSMAEQYAANLAATKFLLSGKNLPENTLSILVDSIARQDFTGSIDAALMTSLDEEADLPQQQNTTRNINTENIKYIFETVIRYPNLAHLRTGWSLAYNGVEGLPEIPVALEQRAILCARRVWGSISSIYNNEKLLAEQLQRVRGSRFAPVENNPRNLQARGDKLKSLKIKLLEEFIDISREINAGATAAKKAALERERATLQKEIIAVCDKNDRFLKGYLEWATRKHKDASTVIDRRFRELIGFIGEQIYTEQIQPIIGNNTGPLPAPIAYRTDNPIPHLQGRLSTVQDAFRASLKNTGRNLVSNARTKAAQLQLRKKEAAKKLHDTYDAYLKVYSSFIEENAVFQNLNIMIPYINADIHNNQEEMAIVNSRDFSETQLGALQEKIELDKKYSIQPTEIISSIEDNKRDALSSVEHYRDLARVAEQADMEAAEAAAAAAAALAARGPSRAASPGDVRMAAARAALAAPAARAAPLSARTAWGPHSEVSLPQKLHERREANRAEAARAAAGRAPSPYAARRLPTSPRPAPPAASVFNSVSRGRPGSWYPPGIAGVRGGYTRTKKGRASHVSKKHRRRISRNKIRTRGSLKRATRNKK